MKSMGMDTKSTYTKSNSRITGLMQAPSKIGMKIIRRRRSKSMSGTGSRARLEKICANCERTFLADSNSQKYCSRECYEKHKSESKIHRYCRQCGKKFSVSWKSKLTMCPTCRGRVRLPPKAPEMTSCPNCGKRFRPFEITHDAKGIHPAGIKFCCIRCMKAYERSAEHEYNS